MSPLRYVSALLLLSVVAFGADTTVLFDPGDRSVGPFPANSFTTPDPQQKTGMRVSLPPPDCDAEPSTCEELGGVNILDGFSIFPRGTVRFSAAPDLDAVQFGTYIVWLDNGFEPAGTMTQIDQLAYDSATDTVFFKPNGALDQGRRYLLVVTEAVTDAAGDPVMRSEAFNACVTAPSDGYCADLSAAVAGLDAPDAVVGASLFTTLSATAWLEAVRDTLGDFDANPRPAGEVSSINFATITSLTLHNETAPGVFANQAFPFPSFLLPNLGNVYFGQFDAPSFLQADQTIAPWPTAGPAPEPTAAETIQFHVLTPQAEPGPNGYPVVLFAHGIGDHRFGGSTIAANGFAAEGFATVAFNAVGHGGGSAGTVTFQTQSGPVTQSFGGRGIDLNGDGSIGVYEGCALPSPTSGLRDCLRQTAVEWMVLRRALENFQADGLNLDLSRVYLAGESLGAIQAALVQAVDPTIEVAALNTGGGTLAELARLSPGFSPILSLYFSQRQPPLQDPLAPFGDEYPLRLRAPLRFDMANSAAIGDVLEIAEWSQMPGDPIAFAPHFKREPLDGVPPKRTMFQIALGDQTVPNPSNSMLIRAADGLSDTSLYRHDRAFAADPTIGENPHVFLVDILTTSGRVIANAAQSQMAGFLSSDGMVIRDANSGIGAPFTEPLFEQPAALPDSRGTEAPATLTSAASFSAGALAPASIASAFGAELATGNEAAVETPLPVTLGGTTIRVQDASGRITPGRMFVVTPKQVNFFLDPSLAEGPAVFSSVNGLAEVSRGTFEVRRLTPAIFAANQMGNGVAAATFEARRSAGTDAGLIFACVAAGQCSGVAVDLGAEGDQVYLVLYGTGLRGVSDLSGVQATIGGETVPVLYAGEQGEFVGLDQVNLGPVPRKLAGSGENEIVLTFDGVAANTVTVTIQ